jgi:hypothetical protein
MRRARHHGTLSEFGKPSLPSSIRRSAVPRWLWNAIARPAGRVTLVTMKPTPGWGSPECQSTVATAGRGLVHDRAC